MSAAQKIATVVRCVERAREEYAQAGNDFRTDFTRQDAAILNVLRACEAAVDLANMAIREHRLGLPSDTRESFAILTAAGLVSPQLGERMQNMAGFRNVAVHQYTKLDLDIVEAVLSTYLDEVLSFAEQVRAHLSERP